MAAVPFMNSSYERVADLAPQMLRTLYDLFERHYADVTFERFASDFGEKEYVILVRDGGGELRGFSTVRTFVREVDGRSVRLLFSGDTIVDPRFWGEQELGRTWSRLAGALSAERPDLPFYWLLLSKGYRTYLYLPLFFHEHYPAREDEFARSVVHDFATQRYGRDFDPRRGVVSFATPHGRLREELGEIGEHRMRSEHVRFFVERNPGFREGDELVCLARLDESNLKSYARRLFLAGRASAGANQQNDEAALA